MSNPTTASSSSTPTKAAVINNREAIITARLRSNIKGATGDPQLGELLTFLPGLNLVDASALRTLRDQNKSFDARFSTKIPQSKAPEQAPEKVGMIELELLGKDLPVDEPFAAIDGKVAARYIEEILAVPMLKDWLKGEGRQDVRSLIVRRIHALENPDEAETA